MTIKTQNTLAVILTMIMCFLLVFVGMNKGWGFFEYAINMVSSSISIILIIGKFCAIERGD